MTTTNNPGDRAGVWVRVAARSAAAVVALVAGAASFEHIASVAIGAGERTWVGYSLPFAIDGLIVVGVAALIEDQRQGRRGRVSARLAVLVGVVATLAANVASADPTATARLVALAAPVSFLISVEVLTRTGRKLSTPDDNTRPVNDPEPATEPSTQPAQHVRPAAAVPVPRVKPRAATRQRTTAARRVAKALQATPDATAAEIAARLGVSERTVQRYRPKPTNHTELSGGDQEPAGDPRPADRFTGNGLAPVPAEAFTRNLVPGARA
jgi:hypothetical protein